MEIPRHWREMPTNTTFSGKERELGNGVSVFKYPGGEVPLCGSLDDVRERFYRKGFTVEVTEQVLFHLFGAIASESSIAVGEVADSFFQFAGSEVGK